MQRPIMVCRASPIVSLPHRAGSGSRTQGNPGLPAAGARTVGNHAISSTPANSVEPRSALPRAPAAAGPPRAGLRATGPSWRPGPLPGLSIRPVELPVAASPRRTHALSIDVEDWIQSVLDASHEVTDRFVAQTRRVARVLDRHRVKATFFVLGNAARHAPSLVRELAASGHEIQIHGFDHRPVTAFSRGTFREDLRRTRGVVEDILGREVFAYRAPRFSIDASNVWALDVLAECGFRYDSSVFPMRVRGYGVNGWFDAPHHVRTAGGCELIEVPVARGSFCGAAIPLGGGGYFRALPLTLIRRQLARIERSGRPAVLYLHPYELDDEAISQCHEHVPLRMRVHQGFGRRGMPRKLENLLTGFHFAPIRTVLGM